MGKIPELEIFRCIGYPARQNSSIPGNKFKPGMNKKR
jgi:hypothetical protein